MRVGTGLAMAALTLFPAVNVEAQEDVLSSLVTVERIEVLKGSGIMRVWADSKLDNPAGCDRGSLVSQIDILLNATEVQGSDSTVETPRNRRVRPRDDEECSSTPELLQLEEIRLMTDAVFFAAMGEYEVHFLIDGMSCSGAGDLGDHEIPVAKGISVAP